MLGTLYKVSDPTTGRDIWLAAMDVETENLWVFDPVTDRFHHNLGLSQDFAWDRELCYEAIDQATANSLREGKLGKTMSPGTARRHGAGIPASTVLGVVARAEGRSLLRSRAQALVGTEPGSWSTWDVYPPSQARAARVCASAVRTGKQRTLLSIAGRLEARLATREDGSIEVQVTRIESTSRPSTTSPP